ncbi:hypothetical protein KSS87_014298 [Heliosperma pusillum]|nr:hypothetical protein KSS87_014298 [Heliosperma pusillum]
MILFHRTSVVVFIVSAIPFGVDSNSRELQWKTCSLFEKNCKEECGYTDNQKECVRGDYALIEDADASLGLYDKPLPCFGCGIGWFSFLLGFVFPLMWYYATILYFRNYYQRDPRERTGLAASAIAGSGKGNDVMGGVKEYELPMFSNWLKKNFVSDDHWEDVVNCLVHHDACGKISTFRTLLDFVTYKKSKLTSMEMGCCKPPVHCGYEYKSNTRWEVPEQGLASQDADCKAWSNDPDKLCYNCETCKGGYLAFFVKGWKKITILNTALLVILFFIFIIAACALR